MNNLSISDMIITINNALQFKQTTQKAIAEYLHVSPKTISRWLNTGRWIQYLSDKQEQRHYDHLTMIYSAVEALR